MLRESSVELTEGDKNVSERHIIYYLGSNDKILRVDNYRAFLVLGSILCLHDIREAKRKTR